MPPQDNQSDKNTGETVGFDKELLRIMLHYDCRCFGQSQRQRKIMQEEKYQDQKCTNHKKKHDPGQFHLFATRRKIVENCQGLAK